MKTKLVNMLIHFTHSDADALGCAMVGEYMHLISNCPQRILFNSTSAADLNVRYFADLVSTIIGNDDPEEKHLAALSSLIYGDENVYKMFPDGFEIPALCWISDVRIIKETADMLEEISQISGMTVLYVDHHKTAEEMHQYKPWCFVHAEGEKEKQKGACQYLLNHTIMSNFAMMQKIDSVRMKILTGFVTMASRYDTWIWKEFPKENPDEYHITAIQNILGSVTEAWKMLRQTLVWQVPEAFVKEMKTDAQFYLKSKNLPLAETLINIYDNQISGIVKKVKYNITFATGKDFADFGVCLNPQYTSMKIAMLVKTDSLGVNDVMEHVKNNYNIDVIMMFYPDTRTISLRRRGNKVNLARLSTILGGGGHPDAAGVKMDALKFKKMLDVYYTKYSELYEKES